MVRHPSQRVDPWLLAEQEKTLTGRIALDSLPRLAPLLVEDTGEAAFVLAFGKDDRQRPVIQSSVTAELRLECQRCLGVMTHRVDSRIGLTVVQGLREAELLPTEVDPLLLQEAEPLEVAQLIEDELLLAIPVSPRHPAGQCQAHGVSEEAAEVPAERDNPFAVLAGLKAGGTNDS